eukprot:TRINITY_DN9339_c0_g3_i4.p1 TRINITY_DN9339_c0_g3~~TRINITY_DN9339_c0_g3_i4.p1  ORF type:complete len:844 (+),score=186.68 TRINITY_DN9339_c0_g3_i4:445-2976(+)
MSVIDQRFIAEKNEMRVEDLVQLCNALVISSKNPLMATIQVAGLFKDLGNVYLADHAEYSKYSSNFTQIALRLIDDFPSDQLATIFLEQQDSNGKSPLSEAQRSENLYFFENPRVSRICEMMWLAPDFMARKDNLSVTSSWFHFVDYLVTNPYQLYTSPYGKFWLRAVFFGFFLFSFSFFIAFETRLIFSSIETISISEHLVYWQGVAFLLNELAELQEVSIKLDIWHVLDLFNYFTISFLFIIRVVLSANYTSNKIKIDCPGDYNQCPEVITYMFTVSIVCISLWVKSLYIFVIDPKLGPLLRTMKKLTRDLTNFFWILFVVWIGFLLAIYSLNRQDGLWIVPNYENFTNALLYTFGIFVGQFSFSDVNTTITNTEIAMLVSILYMLFVLMGMIALVNLLVAMMTRTYSRVQELATQEFLFGKACTVLEYYHRGQVFPPPFSAPLSLIASVVYLIYLARKRVSRQDKFADKLRRDSDALAMTLDAGLIDPKVAKQLLKECYADADYDWSRILEKRHYLEYIHSKKNFKPWRCANCHYFNLSDTYAHLLAYILSRDPSFEKKSVKLISSTSRICRVCKRTQRSITDWSYTFQLVSYWYFLLQFCVPGFILRVLFSLYYAIEHRLYSISHQKVEYQKIKVDEVEVRSTRNIKAMTSGKHDLKSPVTKTHDDKTKLLRKQWALENLSKHSVEEQDASIKVRELDQLCKDIQILLAFVVKSTPNCQNSDSRVSETIANMVSKQYSHKIEKNKRHTAFKKKPQQSSDGDETKRNDSQLGSIPESMNEEKGLFTTASLADDRRDGSVAGLYAEANVFRGSLMEKIQRDLAVQKAKDGDDDLHIDDDDD